MASSRRLLVLALPPLALLALVGLAAVGSDGTPGMPGPAAVVAAGRADGLHGLGPGPASLAKPATELTGTDGLPFDLRERTADARVTLLYFGYTNCPDLCPATMADLANALRMLAPAVRERVQVVFVSVDPARDTSAVLAEWLRQFSPSFLGAVGPFESVAATARVLGAVVERPDLYPDRSVRAGSANRQLASPVYTFDTQDRLRLRYPPGTQVTDYIHDLEVLVNEEPPG